VARGLEAYKVVLEVIKTKVLPFLGCVWEILRQIWSNGMEAIRKKP
jgi:hypothetical protein